MSEYSILPYTQNRKLGNLGKCSFTLNFDSCCNLRFRNNKNELGQKLKSSGYVSRRKNQKVSEVCEFSILPYTQNQKLGNLGKCSFNLNFYSCCNLRFRNNKNELRQKLNVMKWIEKNKKKLSMFPSFRFCSKLKIENSGIS